MDHKSASLALQELTQSKTQKSEEGDYEMIVGYKEDGTSLTRSALELLANHQELSGEFNKAAQSLLLNSTSEPLSARRIAKAAQFLGSVDDDKRQNLLSKAIEIALADESWWMVEDLLKLQLLIDLDSDQDAGLVRRRLEALSYDLDDQYTLWELIREDKSRKDEAKRLQDQLRSPSDLLPLAN